MVMVLFAQLVFLVVALTWSERIWRRRRQLRCISRRFVDAVVDGNYPAADRHVGHWFLAAGQRRPPPPPYRSPSFPGGPA